MSLISYLFAYLLFSIIVNNEAAKILAVFPIPSISHQVVFRPITQELAKRGHEVTVITPDPAFPKGQAPANLTEIDLHDISYSFKNDIFTTSSTNDLHQQVEMIYTLIMRVFERQLEMDEMKNIIRNNKKYDLLLLEACVRPALVFSHVFKAPVIQISSLGPVEMNNNALGSAQHPILYPDPFFHRKIINVTSWEKLRMLYNQYYLENVVESIEVMENEILRRSFGPDVPSLKELSKNIDMLLVNVHAIWDSNRPVPQNVIFLGGLPKKPENKLPKDLQSYLDSSPNGVIYISFGTNVNPSLLPSDALRVFLKVFSQLPYNILWKWDNEDFPGRSENIRISKWFPQSDLLKHPKIKLFITQGGLQSTDEAIAAGVPLIGIPIFADQYYNVEKYVQHNIGIKLLIESINENDLMKAITTIIGNESYRKNVANFRSIINDQPQTSLERAIWWIEYVLRHGGARHLRTQAANMPWHEYLELKIFFSSLLFLFLVISILGFALYYSINFIASRISMKFKIKTN